MVFVEPWLQLGLLNILIQMLLNVQIFRVNFSKEVQIMLMSWQGHYCPKKFLPKGVELVSGGSVINRATPPSFPVGAYFQNLV